MNIDLQLTEAAIEAIEQQLNGTGILKLIYDTDGCGCAVNGVPSLWLVSEPSAFDVSILTNAPFPIVIDRHQTVFFEEQMRLYTQGSGYYKLSSNQQIYSVHVACIDKRHT
ncbi:iron-sulfur cluster biosynthesis family protein [Paenibacillus sp. UMB4589-SE434]|uniref:iron-sulfur cluster biosynthesis family protein n=1 Tax=Paenibacillus sp. UMB4589-SE434 TaxID=3046314 RepID=UPI00254E8FD5|nr:iron-sulfur cluster biosynthesis family protein [Paenibacillus sp. UMB4589-SE434]MDK8179724.1 iron-sulfur cluster biosynthesis family protein [Paenibacillus sp. UMB4589-SE434]